MNKKFIIGMMLCILVLVVLLIWANAQNLVKQSDIPKGRIIFLASPINQVNPWLFMTDGDGNRMQFLSPFSGFSPAWSRDGKFIAVGCQENGAQICIMDATTIPDHRNFSQQPESYAPQVIQKIELPASCRIEANARTVPLSISWSHDAQKLAVVCGFGGIVSSVCLLSQDGLSDCWDKQNSRMIFHIDWSPTEDILAVSGGADASGLDSRLTPSKIYLTDAKGNNKVYLADGWSPEWSPDGKQIAFFTWGKDTYPGIAVINRDGEEFRWLYQSPLKVNGKNDPSGTYLTFSCESMGCRLSWSPDGRFLVLSGSQNGGNARLYRLDLKTGEMIVLLNPYPNTDYSEPDWGP